MNIQMNAIDRLVFKFIHIRSEIKDTFVSNILIKFYPILWAFLSL